MQHKRFILIVLSLFAWGGSNLEASSSAVFEAKKRAYLANDGDGFWLHYERMWGRLENLKLGTYPPTQPMIDGDRTYRPVYELISKQIRTWGASWNESGSPPYGYAWSYAEWYANAALALVLLKYKTVLSTADVQYLQQLYDNYIQNRDFSPGTENSQLHDMVGRYLWAQYYPTVRVTYSYNPPPNTNVKAFGWEGRSYTPGGNYPTYELTRDWIFQAMDTWVKKGNVELDTPVYTWNFIFSFCCLYECAVDPLMKRKAQMMLDFLLLESAMDYSANHWGGAMGRIYQGTVQQGRTRFYWDFFWDTFRRTAHEPSYGLLMCSYRLPEVIWDAADLSDEPDNYYHINMEQNVNIVQAPGTGKWTYVTKFFNLGGRIGAGWQLNIKSEDTPGGYLRPGVPFTLWLNTLNEGEGVTNSAPLETYMTFGDLGYQYKNAMFIRGTKLHCANWPNAWDASEASGKWKFFQEGRTMLAVDTSDSLGTSGLEVGIQGVDYPTFADFKQACMKNCNLTPYKFLTSKGDWISLEKLSMVNDYSATVKRPADSGFNFVWDFPFPRIQTVDHRGQYIVKWEGTSKMTVKRHGVQRVYDFAAWTVTESNTGADAVAPQAPSGVTVR
jgi:hypothetical protein